MRGRRAARRQIIHAAVTNVSQIVALITDDERRNDVAWSIVCLVHPPWIEVQQCPPIGFAVLEGDPNMSRKESRHLSRTKQLSPLAGLVAMGITAPAFADKSVPFPTYVTGPLGNGSYVVSDGQIINPAGIQVDLGIRVRAKAIALNPNSASHTAAVLTLGASEAVVVFDTQTGKVLQNYLPFNDPSRSYGGITYSADGKYLLLSQDSSFVAIANVSPLGLLTDNAQVSVPPNSSFITCFPHSPIGDYRRSCGTFYSTQTSYPR